MSIEMVNEFKLTVVHFARPMRVDLPLDKKTVENQGRATGPPGRRAAGPLGLRVAGPPGRGPLGRGPAFSKTRMTGLVNDQLK